jgi:hypothetical protein
VSASPRVNEHHLAQAARILGEEITGSHLSNISASDYLTLMLLLHHEVDEAIRVAGQAGE